MVKDKLVKELANSVWVPALIVYAATLELRRKARLATARWEQSGVSFLNALALSL